MSRLFYGVVWGEGGVFLRLAGVKEHQSSVAHKADQAATLIGWIFASVSASDSLAISRS